MDDRYDIVPKLEARDVESGLRLWWFGGPSYAIKSALSIVYIDPYYSGDRADDPQGFIRAIPNYFFPDAVTRADAVISTHDHTDHCDRATLRPLYAQTAAVFVAAPSSAQLMAGWGFSPDRVRVMTPGTTTRVGDITLTAYPCNDWDDEGAVTLLLSAGGTTVFIGGDTLYFDALEEIGRMHEIDLAVLALARNRPDIIAQQLYLEPHELARAALALRARRALPVHWEIWQAWATDPATVAPYLSGSTTELVMMKQGEALDV